MTQEQRIFMSNECVQLIYKALEPYKNLSGAEVWANSDGPVFYVQIQWGDWKHEHALAKTVIQEAGFLLINTVVDEENGGDCYSATHYFIASSEVYKKFEEVA